MKQLQLNQMENVKGGSPECLGIATEVMIATIETGVGALFGGLLTYAACEMLK